MGTWRQEAQSVAWDIKQTVNSAATNATSIFDNMVGGLKAKMTGALNGTTVVGINANEITNMRNAIRNYVSNLENHLDQVNQQAETNQAFKGDYAQAIRDYVAAICEACKCVTSNLLAFSDQLVGIQEAYAASDQSLKSAIGSSAGDVQSSFTKYQEKR